VGNEELGFEAAHLIGLGVETRRGHGSLEGTVHQVREFDGGEGEAPGEDEGQNNEQQRAGNSTAHGEISWGFGVPFAPSAVLPRPL
jgi:hypothetical protein